MDDLKWHMPESTKIEKSMAYYPMFADKTKIPASFKLVTIVTNRQDDAQKAHVKEASRRFYAFNVTTCSISGDGLDKKSNIPNQ